MKDAAARRTVDLWPTAAEILGVGRSKIYEMARTGQLQVVRAGRRILVPHAALSRFLGEDRATPNAEQ